MTDQHAFASDVAFTPAVKSIQARKGSREAYALAEEAPAGELVARWSTEAREALEEASRRLPGG